MIETITEQPHDVFYSPLSFPVGEPVPTTSEQELKRQCGAKGMVLEHFDGRFFAFRGDDKDRITQVWVWDENGRPIRHEFVDLVWAGDNPSDEDDPESILSDTLFCNVFQYDEAGRLTSAKQVVVDADGNETLYRDLLDTWQSVVYGLAKARQR